MVDWIVYESWARDLFRDANNYGVKAKDIKVKDIKSYAKQYNLDYKHFKVAVNNQKYKWQDDKNKGKTNKK